MSKAKIDWGKIADQIKTEETKSTYKKKEADPRFYTPDVSKDGYAEVRIRLLPSLDTDIPYVKRFSHGFQGNTGKWFIENCPTTFGDKCPVCEDNSRLWQGSKADKDIASDRSRRLSVITNILVIKDPNHPENDGKVFLWRYGKKLHEKIMDKINPKKGSVDEPVMVFDPENGADFKLKVKRTQFENRSGKKVQSLNYDTSEFAPISALTKEQLEIIEKGIHPLKEFLDRSDFKSYDQLLNLFETKTGTRASIRETSNEVPKEKQADDSAVDEAQPAPESGDGDNDENFFSNLRQKAKS